MSNRIPLFVMVAGLLIEGCGAACGPGTIEEDGACLAAYEQVACGEGTRPQDGECVLAGAELACGEGTQEQDGECVPSAQGPTCGEHTAAVDGVCVIDSGAGVCGPGTVPRGEDCVAAELQLVALPFAAGTKVTVSQSYHGAFSHSDWSRYAVDFPADEGTTVVAARGGRVWQMKESSNKGCATEACANDGNFIAIDHGDGTSALYYHLQQNGALVEVGDDVCAGQPIGKSGNTGWSSGPHLHLEIDDAFGYSMPILFEELVDSNHGVPVATTFEQVSENSDPGACAVSTDYSICPSDLFTFMGITLDSDVPCAVAKVDTKYTISGQSATPGRPVMVATNPGGVQDGWLYECFATDASGQFNGSVTWSGASGQSFAYLMIAVAEDDCTNVQGWEASVLVTLSK